MAKSESTVDAKARQTRMENAGYDPDAKTKGKAFGVATLSDAACIRGFRPWDLGPCLGFEAINAFVNIMAFPSASVSADALATSPALEEALEAFASIQSKQSVRRLPRFKSAIVLSKVSGPAALVELYSRFISRQKSVLNSVEGKIQTLYMYQGLREEDARDRASDVWTLNS